VADGEVGEAGEREKRVRGRQGGGGERGKERDWLAFWYIKLVLRVYKVAFKGI